MSIHTILSQMEMEKKAIDLIIHRQVTGDKLKDDSNILDIFKYLFKAFATRIVEEVGKELIGEDENEYNITPFQRGIDLDSQQRRIVRNKFRASQRTKLQKMKEI